MQLAVTVLANTFGLNATSYKVFCKDKARNAEVPVLASTWLNESLATLDGKYSPI